MKTELIDVSPTLKEIKIEIEPQVVRATYDRISKRYAKIATVPGFRPGHAPVSVIRTRFKSEIRSEVLRELLPETISDAISKLELQPISEPDVHLENSDVIDLPGEQPLSFQVKVEVLPRIELNEYKGIELTRRVRPVTDENVDEVIEHLREASASLQPVEDRSAQLGDTVTVDFVGVFPDNPDEEEIKVEDVDVTLGGEGVQPEFTENLIAVKTDETRTFRVNYPEDFSSKGLAGKKIEYTATVTAVKVKELPEVDDEWARSLGDDFESVEIMRARIREDLENRSAAEADRRLRRDILDELLERHKFEVPQTLIEHEANHRLQDFVRNMIGRGMNPKEANVDWEGARNELKGVAEENIRGAMLLEKIAEQEEIAVSEDEISQEINEISEASRQPRERVLAALTKEGGERSIANRLRNRKALDLLIENARVTDAEWIDETPLVTSSTAADESEQSATQNNLTDEGERQANANSSLS